jgi:hypothetical protein
MFKGILPKRIASSDFTMVTTLADPPATAPNKENQPGASKPPRAPTGKGNLQSRKRADTKAKEHPPKAQEQPQKTGESMEEAFDKLLVCFYFFRRYPELNHVSLQEDLQIPSTLRPRLIGMESTVKAAMLKSSQTMALAPLPLPLPVSQGTPPLTPRSAALRRTRSTESLDSPRHSKASFEYEPPRAPALFGESAQSSGASSVGSAAPSNRKTSGHGRGGSFDASRLLSRSQVHLPASVSVVDLTGKAGKEKAAKDKEKAAKDISPTRFFSILSGTSSIQLDIENVKKLRLLLRNESAR